MLLIILGIVILVAGVVVLFKFNNPVLFLLGILAIIVLTMLGTDAISGYEEPVLQQEYELKPIYEPNTYIIEDSDDSITCKHIIENEHPEVLESYGKYTYNENVKIVVTEEGSKPIMQKYHIKAKKNIFTLSINRDKTKYVFYVPESNIERWQNQHVN